MQEPHEILDELREGYQRLVEEEFLESYRMVSDEDTLYLGWNSKEIEREIRGAPLTWSGMIYLEGSAHKSTMAGTDLQKDLILGIIRPNNLDSELKSLYERLQNIEEEDMEVYAAGF